MTVDSSSNLLAIPKGMRPDPATYMPSRVIESQLGQFDNGASRFMNSNNLEKYGPAQSDGTSFVMPRQQADILQQTTAGDTRALEEALGLPTGYLDSNELVRVDVPNPSTLGLRIPNGNEAGANGLWIPGGKLPTGNLEGVIDLGGAPASSYTTTPVKN